ncbi:MAG: hemerythrin domain-containing protein [Steroidobacteraceae bacterium]
MARRNGASKRKSRAAKPQDAVTLLKGDHREVEGWFQEFEKARSDKRKVDLATRICTALKVHTQIEEEIFYPAFIEATQDEDMHHEAVVEHDGAKKLIAQIEASGPDDDYYDAKVKVLSEMIKHHVKEEEQRGGMFAEAKQSDMDLQALGERMSERKAALMKQGPAGSTAAHRTRQSADAPQLPR